MKKKLKILFFIFRIFFLGTFFDKGVLKPKNDPHIVEGGKTYWKGGLVIDPLITR